MNVDTLNRHVKKQYDGTNKGLKRTFGETLENFDFARGSKRALSDHSIERASSLTAGIGCEPVAFLYHPSIKDDFRVTGLFEAKTVKLLASNIPMHGSTRSLPLGTVVQMYKEEKEIVAGGSSIPAAQPLVALKDIRRSALPGLIDRCNYTVPDKGMIHFLSTDFRLMPTLLHAVAKLHAGSSLVACGDEIVLLLTCEVYSRSRGTDSHAETSTKSIPADSESSFVGICEKSDGAAMITMGKQEVTKLYFP